METQIFNIDKHKYVDSYLKSILYCIVLCIAHSDTIKSRKSQRTPTVWHDSVIIIVMSGPQVNEVCFKILLVKNAVKNTRENKAYKNH